jgi:hypothetical protein
MTDSATQPASPPVKSYHGIEIIPTGRGFDPKRSFSFGLAKTSENFCAPREPWLAIQGEIQRCDWFKRNYSLDIHTGHIQKKMFLDESRRCIFHRTSNHGISPNDSVSDSD